MSEYLNPAAKTEATHDFIARLELDLHRIEMQVVATGGNEDVTLPDGRPAGVAREQTEAAIANVKAHYLSETEALTGVVEPEGE